MSGSSLTDHMRAHHYSSLPRPVKHKSHEKSHDHLSIKAVETPEQPKQLKPPPKSLAAIRDEDWKSLQSSITYLFHKKRLQGLELDTLNEKVRNVRDSKIGQFIVEYYKESILKKGMIVLREAIKEKKGPDLLERLADVWKQFYTNILPTLLAIFYPIQEQGIYIRSVTLVGFRDIVLLKTKIEDAIEPGQKVASEIKQMLLVLASVHDCTPPSDNYIRLEHLVARVVRPYLGVNGLYTESKNPGLRKTSSEQKTGQQKERKFSRTQIFKEEMSRKLRLGSIGSSNSTDREISGQSSKESSLKSRFRFGSSPASMKGSNTDTSELTKAIVDNEMLDYLEYRNQRWKSKEAELSGESLR